MTQLKQPVSQFLLPLKTHQLWCVLVAQNVSIGTDKVGTDSGLDLSQIDWFAEQTVDSTLNRVRQIFTSGHKPTKRQIELESKDAQSFLRQWDFLFLKVDILYRHYEDGRGNHNGRQNYQREAWLWSWLSSSWKGRLEQNV